MRIVDAMVTVVAAHGYTGASVGLVVANARVSRRTFYRHFDGLDDCFGAVLGLAVELPGAVITRAFSREDHWRDGVRSALADLLAFFDSDPRLTRIWFLDVLAVGQWALEQRERGIAALQSLILNYWFPDNSAEIDQVLASGVMASIMGALQTHVVTEQPEPLVTLLAPLTRLVASPFLDNAAVDHEVQLAEKRSQELLEARTARPSNVAIAPARPLPDCLLLPRAHRLRDCLRLVAQRPQVSNHEVGKTLGITHQSQTSKLLSRLAAMGLLSKHAGTPGRPNAWTLTVDGERAVQIIDSGSWSSSQLT